MGKSLKTRQPMSIKDNKLKVIGWFVLVNLAIILWFSVIAGGELLRILPFFLLFGFLVPFVELVLSRFLAKRYEEIRLIDEDTYEDDREKELYKVVEALSINANLPVTPEVGIYEDDDMNAFTTGFTKKKAIIAFSSEMIENMEDTEITAIAAHEIAHIANGDMVISTLVQSVLNVFIHIITIPLLILTIVTLFYDDLDDVIAWILYWVRAAIKTVLLFLGDMIANIFSRQREFKADELAAELVDRDSMIRALKTLGEYDIAMSSRAMRYAPLKVNGKTRFLDIFSTHPSIDRRIERLMKKR
jgi:heat shock protein HtpX